MTIMNLTEMLSQVDVLELDGQACQGMYYRYLESAYKSKSGFVTSRELRQLKGISCPGCVDCVPLEDDLQEGFSHTGFTYLEFADDLNPGDIVQLEIVKESWDRESGILDSWHSKAVKATRFVPTRAQLDSLPTTQRAQVSKLMMWKALPFDEACAKIAKS